MNEGAFHLFRDDGLITQYQEVTKVVHGGRESVEENVETAPVKLGTLLVEVKRLVRNVRQGGALHCIREGLLEDPFRAVLVYQVHHHHPGFWQKENEKRITNLICQSIRKKKQNYEIL